MLFNAVQRSPFTFTTRGLLRGRLVFLQAYVSPPAASLVVSRIFPRRRLAPWPLAQILYSQTTQILLGDFPVKPTGRRTYLKVLLLGLLSPVMGLAFPRFEQPTFPPDHLLIAICANCSHTRECRQLPRPNEKWNCVAGKVSRSLAR